MPGEAENLYYSYDVGPVHFVSVTTEPYYFLQYGLKVLDNQFRWLQQDLSEANREENRSVFSCLSPSLYPRLRTAFTKLI